MAEVIFDLKDKPEADGLVEQVLSGLTIAEKRELLAFMQGFKLAKGTDRREVSEIANMA